MVRAGEIQGIGIGGVQQQWVFLADQTSGLCAAGMPGGGGSSTDVAPWMLAVKMLGAPVRLVVSRLIAFDVFMVSRSGR